MAEYHGFTSFHKYLCEATDFLAEYSWIYEAKNTDVFIADVLEKIPIEWRKPLLNLTLEELRKVPFGFCKDEWPLSLQTFVKDANRLAEFRYGQRQLVDSVENIIVPDFIKKRTPAKKLNEIKWMSAVIYDILLKYHCSTILDFGSGLGYLDQILHYNFGVNVVCFESEEKKSLHADQRIQQGNCTKNIYCINSKIGNTDDSLELITKKLDEIINSSPCSCGTSNKQSINETGSNVLMLGLHSCGSLMQDMMKLFTKLPDVKLFLCVGCCYHQIALSDFPMSIAGKDVLVATKEKHSHWAPSTAGLRLGCQTTRSHWENLSEEEHVQQEKCLFYIAALQHYFKKENLLWCKPKRHLRKPRDISSFENFVDFAFQHVSWPYHEREKNTKKFLQFCSEKEHLFPYIKVLNLLQTLLQPVWEGLVFADRVSYFLENSINPDLFIMCDEQISPRNVVLFGIKS